MVRLAKCSTTPPAPGVSEGFHRKMLFKKNKRSLNIISSCKITQTDIFIDWMFRADAVVARCLNNECSSSGRRATKEPNGLLLFCAAWQGKLPSVKTLPPNVYKSTWAEFYGH